MRIIKKCLKTPKELPKEIYIYIYPGERQKIPDNLIFNNIIL